MRPSRHAISSLVISAVFWFFTRSVAAAGLCLVSGILVDFDHVIEYVIHYGFRDMTYGNMAKTSEDTCKLDESRGFPRVYLFFHIAEIAICIWIAWLVTKNIYILSIAIGYTSHLVLDYAANPPKMSFYFFTWRFIHKFSSDHFFRKNRKK